MINCERGGLYEHLHLLTSRPSSLSPSPIFTAEDPGKPLKKTLKKNPLLLCKSQQIVTISFLFQLTLWDKTE